MAKLNLTSGETIDDVPMLVAAHGYVANSIELTGKDVTAMRRLFERDPAGFRAFIVQFEARFPENRAPHPEPTLGRLGEVKIDPASVTLNGDPAVWSDNQGWVTAPPSDPRWVRAPVLKAGDRVVSNGEPAIYDGHDFAPTEAAPQLEGLPLINQIAAEIIKNDAWRDHWEDDYAGGANVRSKIKRILELSAAPPPSTHVAVTDEAVTAACRAHTPQFDRLDAEIARYAKEQMRDALTAALKIMEISR